MLESLLELTPPEIPGTVIEQVETDIKYAGYLARETRRAEQTQRLSSIKIPESMDYMLPGISNEVAERLSEAQPINLATAARLPGVTPAAIDILAIHLSKIAPMHPINAKHLKVLEKWRHAMDLVGPGPLEPHFEDAINSVQIYQLCHLDRSWFWRRLSWFCPCSPARKRPCVHGGISTKMMFFLKQSKGKPKSKMSAS